MRERVDGTTLHRLDLPLASELSAAREARTVLRACGEAWGLSSDVLEVTLLLASELITNAVVHGAAPVHVSTEVDGEALLLQVSDGSTAQPAARAAPPEAGGGRGLHLLAALSRAWGVHDAPDGKTVWCSVSLGS